MLRAVPTVTVCRVPPPPDECNLAEIDIAPPAPFMRRRAATVTERQRTLARAVIAELEWLGVFPEIRAGLALASAWEERARTETAHPRRARDMAEICWSHWALQVESFVDACRGNPKKYRLSADCEATAAFCGVEPMVWNEYNPLPDYDAYRSRVDVVRLLLRAAHGVRGERQSRPPARQGLRLIVGGKK